MGNDNKKARQQLEMQFGKGCMFKAARIEDQVEALKTIKTYKTFLRETRYTGKKIRQLEKNITFHHLRHRSEGGKASADNGANINELAHRYVHSLPREQEEVINNMLRKFKLQGGVITPTSQGLDVQPFEIEMDLARLDEEDCLIIPVYDTTEKDRKKKEKYNRAQTKQKFQRQIDKALYGPEEDEEDLDWDR